MTFCVVCFLVYFFTHSDTSRDNYSLNDTHRKILLIQQKLHALNFDPHKSVTSYTHRNTEPAVERVVEMLRARRDTLREGRADCAAIICGDEAEIYQSSRLSSLIANNYTDEQDRVKRLVDTIGKMGRED